MATKKPNTKMKYYLFVDNILEEISDNLSDLEELLITYGDQEPPFKVIKGYELEIIEGKHIPAMVKWEAKE